MNDDTSKLLKECIAGVKTAVGSINEVIDRPKSQALKELLRKYVDLHEALGGRIHKELIVRDEKDKDPSPIGQAMSWLTTHTKLLMEPTDEEVASLMMDGCNMGIQSVSGYMNQYPAADPMALALAEELVRLEQDFMDALRKYR